MSDDKIERIFIGVFWLLLADILSTIISTAKPSIPVSVAYGLGLTGVPLVILTAYLLGSIATWIVNQLGEVVSV